MHTLLHIFVSLFMNTAASSIDKLPAVYVPRVRANSEAEEQSIARGERGPQLGKGAQRPGKGTQRGCGSPPWLGSIAPAVDSRGDLYG